ncbi:hypothetical protein BGW38_007561 [Lunasporangiospora selenospora]|uniref:Zinc transporter ZupT n=1 Tax=Lunasporangiospora selenospora TaxID=979761 RepID=A0A9P6G4W4_9FUNG|nr:hypothetical protein BGW38_007561 [Lunasporangiospora selenospora]
MLVASFLAGNIPLSFHLSEDRLKLFSNFGVGLLVGTSLVVIIPEGVETLYSVQPENPSPPVGSPSGITGHNKPIKRSLRGQRIGLPYVNGIQKRQDALPLGPLLAKRSAHDSAAIVVTDPDHPYVLQARQLETLAIPSTFEDNMLRTRMDEQAVRLGNVGKPLTKRQGAVDDEGAVDDVAAPDNQADDNDNDDKQPDNDNGGQRGKDHLEDGHDEEEEENDAHKYIGLALISGFILMFLIDQMGPTHAHSHNNHVSVADFTELHNLQLDDNNIRMPSAVGMNSGAKKRGNPITIGLVVHAAADGIALGASATRPELRFIVFLAIMLHKAPAAFGLASVLLQHGFSRRQTRQQVGIFSLAAPIGAVLTYMFIHISGKGEATSLHWWTGMLLLFSGGTFLYVAMHVMSEMNNAEKGSSGYNVGSGVEKGLSVVEVLCVIGGMVVPLILSVDHEH